LVWRGLAGCLLRSQLPYIYVSRPCWLLVGMTSVQDADSVVEDYHPTHLLPDFVDRQCEPA